MYFPNFSAGLDILFSKEAIEKLSIRKSKFFLPDDYLRPEFYSLKHYA